MITKKNKEGQVIMNSIEINTLGFYGPWLFSYPMPLLKIKISL